MPGTRCSVAVCQNSLIKTKKENADIHYYRFPKSGEVRKQWIHATRREGKWNPDTSYLCSVHFDSDDYERDLKSELLGLKSRNKLKPDAVPSKNLGFPCKSVSFVRKVRHQKRAQHKLVEEILQSTSIEDIPVSKSDDLGQSEDSRLFEENLDNKNIAENSYKDKYEKLLEKYEQLQLKLDDFENKTKSMKFEIRRLQKNLIHYKSKKVSDKIIETEVRKILSNIFTNSQLQLLLKKKRKVLWKEEDFSNALTLKYLSKRSYVFIRQKLHYPLPSLSTLNRWENEKILT